MKSKTYYKHIAILVLCISIIAIIAVQYKKQDVPEGLIHRIFYGNVSELATDDGVFTLVFSELEKSKSKFIFTEETLNGNILELHVGDYIKVESEYYESLLGPDFKYPVLTVEHLPIPQ